MTYPDVKELTPMRTEWLPEQIAVNESVLRAREVQRQRLQEWEQKDVEHNLR